MHEFSLMADLMRKIEQVAADNNARRVTRVRVWLGALSHITPEHFREHFEDGTRGTVAEGAELEVETSDDETHPEAQQILLRSLDVA
ncbi:MULTISPECIES: hydrogenase maturation nickel metallochaperone HypA [Thioalkalivibrio]|uniref:Hydrogenase nickel incorporation protein HypA n=1 Tax=Thioalkalivibrio versutus TaxID=106634 RepID=A0A0G3G9P7_9GAMM|nr:MULTISPECIES: hydrogenase maturation nickel metallochaperone HypA [Thioalkalivibrio]AKJ96277.1 hydrogenase nickel incorporation protein HypA [Thioalkalivibrio versutus]OOC50230.1 hydrogenase nickel incorporation protein HypA [Thioalkalivibrio versutus]